MKVNISKIAYITLDNNNELIEFDEYAWSNGNGGTCINIEYFIDYCEEKIEENDLDLSATEKKFLSIFKGLLEQGVDDAILYY